jgi:PadR family transcriptional regulator, regulatory protein PadR
MSIESWAAQALKGLSELVVLRAIGKEESYGYEILQRLAAAGPLELVESTIYPLLSRLTREGFLSVRKRSSPHGPPRRYYRLTTDGRARLEAMERYWETMTRILQKLKEGNL